MPIKLVVFDMAGTTIKDDFDASKAFKASLKKSHYDVPPELIAPLMGYEKKLAIRQILRLHEHNDANITVELVNKINNDYEQKMMEHYRQVSKIELLPHVEETFAKLQEQGIQVGINTGMPCSVAHNIIDRLKWKERGLINHIVASDEVELGRPYNYMIKKMMIDGGIARTKEVAKVGDSEADVREGQNAFCRYVIGVTTGMATRKQLEPYHPTHIIDDLTEVIDIIN